MPKTKKTSPKTIIGRSEWCAFPELGLPAVKARIDTGAKTSALHAYDMEVVKQDDNEYVRFKIHPLQGNLNLERECIAPLHVKRIVISSNGERERRYVIKTKMQFGTLIIPAELTLTSRHNMRFRMLLGREAMRKAKFIVDPSKTMLLGKIENVKNLYQQETE